VTFRSASSLSLNVRRTRLSIVGDQAFPVTAAPTCHLSTLYQALCLFSEAGSRLSSSQPLLPMTSTTTSEKPDHGVQLYFVAQAGDLGSLSFSDTFKNRSF